MDKKKALIHLQNLSFAYPHAKQNALNGIDCKIFTHEYVEIVGPNGAGKSTLANHLMGILLAQSG